MKTEVSKPVVLYVTITLPNGLLLRLPVNEGEDVKKKIEHVIDNWISNTKDDPKKYDNFVLKEDRCPKCGGALHAHIMNDYCFIWCINYPECGYMNNEVLTHKRVFEKYGIELVKKQKEGVYVAFSNKPCPPKKK